MRQLGRRVIVGRVLVVLHIQRRLAGFWRGIGHHLGEVRVVVGVRVRHAGQRGTALPGRRQSRAVNLLVTCLPRAPKPTVRVLVRCGAGHDRACAGIAALAGDPEGGHRVLSALDLIFRHLAFPKVRSPNPPFPHSPAPVFVHDISAVRVGRAPLA